ncbi:DNA-binding protein [Achromobacter xylosoxidans]|uniref:DNA-binding protein n=1 Tax=Alcaligenes xylosoxydans xylosoxydans TaxID=85698 RepID=UPI0015C5F798|nr:DNA-binding protein [Achromobacter xylosoxidans]
MQKPSMERAFRQALTDPETRAAVRDRLGWDDSQVSRFLSGQMGLTIEKLDAAIECLAMVVTTRKYLDFLAYGAQVGTACYCARAGMGECGVR